MSEKYKYDVHFAAKEPAGDAETVFETACKAVGANGEMQGVVVSILADPDIPRGAAQDLIAKAMSKFRTWGELHHVTAGHHDPKERGRQIKQVNNVINDVSRICREEAGFSVRLTSRKNGYTYDTFEESLTKKAKKPKEPKVDFDSEHGYETEIGQGVVKKMVQYVPTMVVTELFSQYNQDQLKELFNEAAAQMQERKDT